MLKASIFDENNVKIHSAQFNFSDIEKVAKWATVQGEVGYSIHNTKLLLEYKVGNHLVTNECTGKVHTLVVRKV